jgi:O-antigen ligase
MSTPPADHPSVHPLGHSTDAALAASALRHGGLSTRAWLGLTLLALAVPVLLLPLLQRPGLILAGGVGLAALVLAAVSPAIPLGLVNADQLVPLVGSVPVPVVTAVSVWILVAMGIVLLRGPGPMPKSFVLPIALSLALLGLMLMRLSSSATADYGQHKIELFVVVNMVVLLGGLMVGRRRRDVEICLGIIMGVATIAAIGVLVQILSGAPPLFEGRYALSNNVQDYDPIELGRLTAAGTLIALHTVLNARTKLVRTVALYALPVLTVAFLGSGGRGPVVGMIAALAVLVAGQVFSAGGTRRAILLAGAIVVCVVVASQIVPSDAFGRAVSAIIGGGEGRDANGRSELWTAAWRAFQDHPWLGVGTGGFAAIEPAEMYPHNLILETGAEWGLAGLVPLFALIIVGAKRIAGAVRRPVDSGHIVVLVAALFVAALVNAMFSADITRNSDVWLMLGLGIGLASRTRAMAAAESARRWP